MARILLTEDDDAVRTFVARALTMDGHEVVEAIDGEEGFDRLRAEARANGAPGFDLLLTDIMMPFMDGIALSKEAAREHPDLPILMMTGFANQRERADDVDAIVIDVVAKPFTLSQIRQAVQSALSQPKAA